ncbi:MAG TPA: UbiA family prenyltransferase [Candidatus Binataceae bacterium]|nr:UbiA family prenyltransferase [Candidatus Binataceae bacterium]
MLERGLPPEPGRADTSEAVLCVDLDGTLVKSDTLAELILQLLRRSPLYILLLPWWLMSGRVRFKAELMRRVGLRVDLLPYRAELLEFIRRERQRGRRVVLVTAAPLELARQVAEYLGGFDEVIATSSTLNVAGANKRDLMVTTFGAGQFDYIGNAKADVVCFQAARRALVAAPQWRLRRCLHDGRLQVARYFDPHPATLRAVVGELRISQWGKNLLVFLPLLLAHKFHDGPRLLNTALFFGTLSLTASAGYLINDLLDLEADRLHARKRFRPLAAGTISGWVGMAALPLLLVPALGLSLAVGWPLTLCLLGYLAGTLIYSFYAKRIAVLDALALAGLYTFRILAGGIAARVPISPWMMAFSMFFFLSLAFLKRYSEMRASTTVADNRRGYGPADLEQIRLFGTVAAYVSTLVLALYVSGNDVALLYSKPQWLWLLCVVVIYWLSRAWLLASRGELEDDPFLFAMTDPQTYGLGLAIIGIMLLAL